MSWNKSLLETYREREEQQGSGYEYNRTWLAGLASPLISEYLSRGYQPNLLEIGCGTGDSLNQIRWNHPDLEPQNITGTSLTLLPELNALLAQGIKINTGVIAEDLPGYWSENFDIVMACATLQWTDTSRSIREILRTLKPGGHFIGFDIPSVLTKSMQYVPRGFAIIKDDTQWINDYQSFHIQKT